jgi:hypothetical protein
MKRAGSYTRDPKSGELKLTHRTKKQPVQQGTPSAVVAKATDKGADK